MNPGTGLWVEAGGKRICMNPWTHFEVNDPNGNVTMCCDHGDVLGNVNRRTITEIWNGTAFQKIRNEMGRWGAEALCGRECLLLNGMKPFQSMEWYKHVPSRTALFRNARLNEMEIRRHSDVLLSRPRWIRFAASWNCNYRCIHCYQASERFRSRVLPEEFFSEVRNGMACTQVVFLYGGEPMCDPGFNRWLALSAENPYLRFVTVTNGSLIHLHAEAIRKASWSAIGISLDAADSGAYRSSRRSDLWDRVMDNVDWLSALRKSRGFDLWLDMRMNRTNADQISRFAAAAWTRGAVPKISLVNDSKGNLGFWIRYLAFSGRKIRLVLSQIASIRQERPGEQMRESGLDLLEKHFGGGFWRINGRILSRTLQTGLKSRLPRPVVLRLVSWKRTHGAPRIAQALKDGL